MSNVLPPPPHHNRRLPLHYEKLENIRPNPRDPRTYRRADRRRIAAMVRKFGPALLIVTPDGTMLSGNIWLEANIAAGYDEVPVMVAEHLTPAEADAYMLAYVKFVELGEWDQQRTGELLLDLSEGELKYDLELTGFDQPEIDIAIESLSQPAEGADPADEPASAGPPVTRLGDLWRMGDRHRLLCGDSLDPRSFKTLLPGEAAKVIVTDPPFNTRIENNVSGLGRVKHRDFVMCAGEKSPAEFTAFLETALGHAAANCAPGALAYAFMDWRHVGELLAAGGRVFDRLMNVCVWTKNRGGMGGFYRSAHEMIFVFKKGKARHCNNIQLGRFGRDRTNVWAYPGVSSFGRHGEEGDLLAIHPTVKPVAMLADILLDVTARGDIALDPFAGSGSLLIAAEKVGRRGRAIELDPVYVDAAVRRWRKWSGEEAFLEGDGRSFAQIEAERAQEPGGE